MTGEFDFIRAIRTRIAPAPGVSVGPGDDCAVLKPTTRPMLITTDVLTEGIDFLLAETTPEAVGRKAMAVNLSDIAAMGGTPRYAVVGLVLPRTNAAAIAEGVQRGLAETAARYATAIVGGDTNSWDGGLVVSVTLIGEAPEGGAILRSGAKVGDELFVTGPCGGSLLGRHLNPTPRLAEAGDLIRRFCIHAMIDVSDGLAADLQHILEESDVGAKLFADAIPIHADAVLRSRLTGRTPLKHALNDGEDFELIFAAPPGQAIPYPRIGVVTESGFVIVDGGVETPVVPKGWTHF